VLGKTKLILVLFLAAALLLPGCAGNKGPAVYAVVNGQEITREDFQRYENFLRLAQPELEFSRDEQKKVLQDLIDMQVLLSGAEERDFTVDMDAVHNEYKTYRTQVMQNDMFGGSAAIYHTRLMELGLSEDWIIQLFKSYNLINAMVAAEKDKAKAPDDKTIEDYYEKNKESLYAHGELRRVRHILVNSGNFPDAEDDVSAQVKELANTLYERLQAGADFAALAKEFSQDGSAQSGGDIGFIEKSDVVQTFGEVAFSAALNAISKPVESVHGWHIIQVVEIKPAGYYELDADLRAKISASLLNKEQQDLVTKLITELRDQAEISINFK